MATIDRDSQRLKDGHEEFFEHSCGICEEEEKLHVEAVAYCPVCPGFLCKSHKQQHGRFRKDHAILGPDQKNDWGKAKPRPPTGPGCPTHPDQSISTFCPEHGDTCCPVCVPLDHRDCKGLGYLPKFALGIAKSDEFLQLQTKLDDILTKVDRAVDIKKTDESSLKESTEQVLNEIAAMRMRINDTLDKLEQRAKDTANKIARSIASHIENLLIRCAEYQKEFESLKSDFQNIDKQNETELFIKVKRCQKKITECEEVINRCSKPEKPRLTFIENVSLLVSIDAETSICEIEPVSIMTNRLYRVKKHQKIDVSLPGESQTCYNDGLCQMADGRVVISDKNNCSVKLMNTDYTITDSCIVPDKPYGACAIGPNAVAVALVNQSIQRISLVDGMKLNACMKLGHECFGLAYQDGLLYVTDREKKIYVHSMTGSLLRTIQTDRDGTNLFSQIRLLTFSPDGSRLYVTDRNIGLIILDRNGRRLSAFNDPQLNAIRGICLDNHGNIFVGGNFSHNIVQLDNKGQRCLGTVAGDKYGFPCPLSAVFDNARGTLLVSSGYTSGCNELTCFYLEQQ